MMEKARKVFFTIGRIKKGGVSPAGFPVPMEWETLYEAYGYSEALDLGRSPEELIGGSPTVAITHRLFFQEDIRDLPMDLVEGMEAVPIKNFQWEVHKDIPRYRFVLVDPCMGHHWEIQGRRMVESG